MQNVIITSTSTWPLLEFRSLMLPLWWMSPKCVLPKFKICVCVIFVPTLYGNDWKVAWICHILQMYVILVSTIKIPNWRLNFETIIAKSEKRWKTNFCFHHPLVTPRFCWPRKVPLWSENLPVLCPCKVGKVPQGQKLLSLLSELELRLPHVTI